jgi:hypothetical protein
MVIARVSFILRTISSLIMVLSISFPAYAKYRGGSGDPFNPYRIATAEDLIQLGENPDDYDKDFILTADIDMDPNLPGRKVFDKAVIAPNTGSYSTFYGTAFTGVFDGEDHTISNLTINGENSLGLFGKLGPGGEISNLGLIAVDVNGINDYAGGLAAYNEGTIMASYSIGSVSCDDYVGGLVGQNSNRIIACYSSGTVSGDNYIGGLAGQNSNALVSNCYSTCIASGNTAIGGLVGDNSTSIIRNCYSIGAVSGRTQVGGLCGMHISSGTVINCFWDRETSGGHYSAGGWAVSTAEMTAESTYIGWNNGAWVIDEGRDYPHLIWENALGKVIDYEYPQTYPGNGQDQPFELDGQDDLICMSQRQDDWDKNFVLTGDIDMSSVIDYRPPALFTGTLDGQNHILKNLKVDTSIIGSRYHLGVFGKIADNSQVANLGIEDVNIIGGDDSRYVGGLCGENAGGTIINCYVTGLVTGHINSANLGGLCGDNMSGTIEQSYSHASVFTKNSSHNIGGLCGANNARINGCYATGSVNTGRYSGVIGGLVGNSSGGTISNCYATGEVNSEDESNYLGGLVGYNCRGGIIGCYSEGAVIVYGHCNLLGGLVGYNQDATISNCYAKGSVSGGENSAMLGGLVGSNEDSFIRNCYSIGSVSGGTHVGGLCGRHSVGGAIVNGFWDKDASGNLYSAGGWAMTTAEMMSEATYVGWNNGAWVIDEGKDYPHLLWENTAGEVIDYEYPRTYSGDGEDQPFELDSPEDMLCMSQRPSDWDKNFVLTGDIDMSSVIYYQPPIPFTGNFYGQGHVLKNLTIDSNIIGSRYYLGVFGKIADNGQVANLGVEDVNIIGGDDSRYVGGLCGENSRGTITCCFTTGSITGGLESDDLGGLCGDNERGTISQSYSRVSITAGDESHDIGGLCGKNEGTITDCYATGAISGGKTREVGGFCGENHRRGIITNCYCTGPVSGESQVGGFCGDKEGGDVTSVSNCLWDIETSGTLTSEAGTGLTTAEMQQAQTFLDIDWDFVDETRNGMDDIWWIDEGRDYPRLWWEAE